MLIDPIGYVTTEMQSKFQAPHQPSDHHAKPGVIELLPDKNFEHALMDLEGFEYIWVLWHAHKNRSWRPKVLPPRGPAKRRGVFATRSPHRPNPICMTAVRLLKTDGRKLFIGECDLVTGTPVIDIKPYLPEVDSFPEARIGWLQEVHDQLAKPVRFAVTVNERASEQLSWLRDRWNIDFLPRAVQLLERDPTPHRSRRIRKVKGNLFRMGCGPWRLLYTLQNETIAIIAVEPGYPYESLFRAGFDCITDRDAQIEFYQQLK